MKQDEISILLEAEIDGKVIDKKQGASGAVYIMERGDEKIAYKTIRIDKLDDVKKQHFLEECEIWLKIQSNYIATAFYPKIIGDNLFIVMPYFDCSLQSLLEDVAKGEKHITYLDALVITCKITKALIELKRSGVNSHQDFNPPNILIQLLDKKFRGFPTNNYINYDIKIADFGMANLRERIGLTIGGSGGKFPYKAPEQYEPKKYTIYNPDIFALGIMVYMLFTGKHPNGLDNEKALQKSTPERKFKSWILLEEKNIEPIKNTDLQSYINRMFQNNPAERPALEDFYTFILKELEKENFGVHYQLVGLLDYIDVFDVTGDRIDRLYKLNNVAGLPDLEQTIFNELYEELNAIKSNLTKMEDVVYYSEILKFLNRFFKKGYLQQDLVKEEYLDNVRIWYKWYKKMKISHLYGVKKEYRGSIIYDSVKNLKEYEAAGEYIYLAIAYLLELDTEIAVEAFLKTFNDDVFLSYFYYYRAFDWYVHQKDIYKTLEFLSKAKEKHPTEVLFYCKEGKWIEHILIYCEYDLQVLPIGYKLDSSQKEELTAKMQVAFEYCKKGQTTPN